jgi:hypothetical protein
MTISSRTPDGFPFRCPICGHEGVIDPSKPGLDAPCPSCGSLIWFGDAKSSPVQRLGHDVAHSNPTDPPRQTARRLPFLLLICLALAAAAVTLAAPYSGLELPEYIVLAIIAILLFGRALLRIAHWIGREIVGSNR